MAESPREHGFDQDKRRNDRKQDAGERGTTFGTPNFFAGVVTIKRRPRTSTAKPVHHGCGRLRIDDCRGGVDVDRKR